MPPHMVAGGPEGFRDSGLSGVQAFRVLGILDDV